MEDYFVGGHDPIWNVLLRFAVDLVVLFIVIRLIYYRYTKNKGNAFSFFLMGIMIFLVCILLKTVKIDLGVALGLFAIFAILRFRSRNLDIRDMTYFFTILGISVINAMASFYNPVRGQTLINLIIIATLLILEFFFQEKPVKKPANFRLIYDRLELLDPEKKGELLKDLSARTNIQIEKVKIRQVDLAKGNAELTVYYKDGKKSADTAS